MVQSFQNILSLPKTHAKKAVLFDEICGKIISDTQCKQSMSAANLKK